MRPLVSPPPDLYPSHASLCLVMEGELQELGLCGNLACLGIGPTVVLDSLGGEGFLIF